LHHEFRDAGQQLEYRMILVNRWLSTLCVPKTLSVLIT